MQDHKIFCRYCYEHADIFKKITIFYNSKAFCNIGGLGVRKMNKSSSYYLKRRIWLHDGESVL